MEVQSGFDKDQKFLSNDEKAAKKGTTTVSFSTQI